MPTLVPFSFEDHNIRTIVINGEPLFVAKDIAVALGYTNPQKAVRDHCKRAKSLKDMDGTFRSVQQNQAVSDLDPKTKIIPEPDVYRLITNSNLPSAERFETWLFEEVLPSIRKTGGYQLPERDLRAAPAIETINSADERAISNIVDSIASAFHFRGMAKHAIYSGLRRRYGIQHTVGNLPTCYFHDALDTLVELDRAARMFSGALLDAEKDFCVRTFRYHLPFDQHDFDDKYQHELKRIDNGRDHTLKLVAINR